jgi:hypothetical protein
MPVRKRNKSKKTETANRQVTLDDVVSLFIQIEPNDKKKFRQLSRAITDLSKDKSLDAQILSLAMEAKERIDLYMSGKTTDAEDVLAEASMLLEQAANVRDNAIYPVKNHGAHHADMDSSTDEDELIESGNP